MFSKVSATAVGILSNIHGYFTVSNLIKSTQKVRYLSHRGHDFVVARIPAETYSRLSIGPVLVVQLDGSPRTTMTIFGSEFPLNRLDELLAARFTDLEGDTHPLSASVQAVSAGSIVDSDRHA